MFKLGLFVFLFWLLGNPFIAIIVMLLLLYLLDLCFIGIPPSILKPLKRLSRIRKLRQQIDQSPNDVYSKHELARKYRRRETRSRRGASCVSHAAQIQETPGTPVGSTSMVQKTFWLIGS